ncbi:Mannose-6-phosphate isomerase [Artemisia annua]|uniref:Mannose-6-phosphate isomerase n=1 Tax=Artemisia annua TaxID=35608 RepID=A0A2U1NQ48_ARTAN|nr:Mannose-6-phosphate isomerase [Artemisia annua]
MVIENMASEGKEPTFCMGDDIPLAVFSQRSHMLYDYFKQRFAPVSIRYSFKEITILSQTDPFHFIKHECIECMAASDSVVRAGLTPKYMEVKILCSMLTYKQEYLNPYVRRYTLPNEEFEVLTDVCLTKELECIDGMAIRETMKRQKVPARQNASCNIGPNSYQRLVGGVTIREPGTPEWVGVKTDGCMVPPTDEFRCQRIDSSSVLHIPIADGSYSTFSSSFTVDEHCSNADMWLKMTFS